MMWPLLVLLGLANWLMCQLLVKSCHGSARKVKSHGFHFVDLSFKPLHQPSSFPSIARCDLKGRGSQTLACDIHRVLLRTHSFFPYFMLVAFEGGSIFRAFLLLCSYPVLWFFNYEMKLRFMIFITFCGLRIKDMENTARAVLPKFYLENLNLQVYEVVNCVGSTVFFTSMPRVMVEGFLREYLNADAVFATELHTVGCYFSGLLCSSGLLVKHCALKDYFGDTKPHLGISSTSVHDQLFISHCKEAYVVMNEESKEMPRDKYPKPLIFHDGRLAFLPTPSATLSMFLWLPIGIPLAIYRVILGVFLCSPFTLMLATWTGIHINVKDSSNKQSVCSDDQNLKMSKTTCQININHWMTSLVKSSFFNWVTKQTQTQTQQSLYKGVLYVCTHRTLLDPIFLSVSLRKRLTAVTYSLSRMSELIAPIRTMKLTRERKHDEKTMKRLLSEGDLVVFPEGTTCREPYLLRFSSLFAELADDIVPVAINAQVTMFYGTTATGFKCLDPFFFFMNPKPCYHIEMLEKVPKELTCSGGKSSHEVANYMQKQLGVALGFECTKLTRKDKYMMLAGNEGVVVQDNKGRQFP